MISCAVHHQPQTVLITGGCGFIGVNFIQHLLRTDTICRVVNLDALTYAGSHARLAEEARTYGHRYRFVQGNVCDDELLRGIFAEETPNTVIHFAAESHVDRAISGPDPFVQTNVIGTLTLLKAAHQAWHGRSDVRFHQVSTDEVFGSLPATGLFTESSPYRPANPYSASKAAGDHLVRAWHTTYGLPVTISHGSNTYGPHQFPEKLIPLALARALAEFPIPLYGDGQHRRDWIHVEDHVRAIDAIVRHAATGATYLIGSDQELTNQDLLTQLCRILDGLRPRPSGMSYRELITHVPDRPGHDRRYATDAARLRNELGWVARVPLERGLSQTAAHYAEQFNSNG